MKYSYYKQCITPKFGTALAGYGPRLSAGVYDDLFLQMLLMVDDRNQRLLLIAADLIGFESLFVKKMRQWIIRQNLGLTIEAINFNATHTHCGPATALLMAGPMNPAYLSFLEAAIKKGVATLAQSLTAGALYCGQGRCALAVNRRLRVTHVVGGRRITDYVMRPNLSGSVDHHLGLLCIRGKDEEIILLNYACHATTRGGCIVSGDYPSAAVRALRANTYSKREVIFLQGAAGDVRVPFSSDSDNSAEAVIRNGNMIAATAQKALSKGLEKINPEFRAARVAFVLPYDKKGALPIPPDKKNEYCRLVARRARYYGGKGVRMEWTIWKLNRNCIMVALPGEVCHEIGLMAKKALHVKYPYFLGYTNGLPGYIPTDKIICEGGYEGKRAIQSYGQPYPFKLGVDRILHDTLSQAMILV